MSNYPSGHTQAMQDNIFNEGHKCKFYCTECDEEKYCRKSGHTIICISCEYKEENEKI